MRPADRTWELERWDGQWCRIIAMDAETVVIREYAPAKEGEPLAQHGILWCEPGTFMSCLRARLRYTVPVPDPEGSLVPMEWRPAGIGKLPMLAMDMDHPEVAEGIRRASSET